MVGSGSQGGHDATKDNQESAADAGEEASCEESPEVLASVIRGCRQESMSLFPDAGVAGGRFQSEPPAISPVRALVDEVVVIPVRLDEQGDRKSTRLNSSH